MATTPLAQTRVYGFGDLVPMVQSGQFDAVRTFLLQQVDATQLQLHHNAVLTALLGMPAADLESALQALAFGATDPQSDLAAFWDEAWAQSDIAAFWGEVWIEVYLARNAA